MTDCFLLNTRSLDQSHRVHQAFEPHGFVVIDLPCIEITGPENEQKVLQQMAQHRSHQVVVFTSQYAVRQTFSIQPNWRLDDSCQVIAVGQKTAEVLEQHFRGDVWLPAQHNSQGVIALLQGMKKVSSVCVMSAPKGRQLIEHFVKQQGWQYEQINVYQRQKPEWRDDELEQALNNQPMQVMVTSVSILDHLQQGLNDGQWLSLLDRVLLCASERIRQEAIKRGFKHCIDCKTAHPEGMSQIAVSLLNG